VNCIHLSFKSAHLVLSNFLTTECLVWTGHNLGPHPKHQHFGTPWEATNLLLLLVACTDCISSLQSVVINQQFHFFVQTMLFQLAPLLNVLSQPDRKPHLQTPFGIWKFDSPVSHEILDSNCGGIFTRNFRMGF
jgi:hypothetical protein